MKKTIAVVTLTFFGAVAALAANETKILPAPAVGDVTFPHKKHQDLLEKCTFCHENAAGGKIAKLASKDEAHKLCKGCHETKKKGPTRCGECHKKKR